MKRIYFNNSSGAYPLAPEVIEAITQSLQNPPQISGRDAAGCSDSLEQCRKNIATILGVNACQTVLTSGATYGLNAALLGLGLKQDDLVVTTVMEHNSVLRPLAYLEDLCDIKVEYVPLSTAGLDLDVYDRLLEKKPRLVVLTHASNVVGRINPVRLLFKKAKSVSAATLLDASQTVGRIPVKPDELHADMVVFSGHKGLRGPLGTGVLYVSPETEIKSVFTGGTGIKSDLRLQPKEMPIRLESGTPNTPAFAGLNAAVSYYMENMDDIATKEKAIAEKLVSGLMSIPNVRVLDEDPCERLPVISFVIDGMDVETAGFALSESFGIECRTGLHCAPLMHKALGITSNGSVRLSPSYVNTPEEIDYAIEAVKSIVGGISQ